MLGANQKSRGFAVEAKTQRRLCVLGTRKELFCVPIHFGVPVATCRGLEMTQPALCCVGFVVRAPALTRLKLFIEWGREQHFVIVKLLFVVCCLLLNEECCGRKEKNWSRKKLTFGVPKPFTNKKY